MLVSNTGLHLRLTELQGLRSFISICTLMLRGCKPHHALCLAIESESCGVQVTRKALFA